jgi:pimeloyl-ACP methyl ester carboxylesterase
MTFVFVNGILNFPGNAEGWTDLAASYINSRTPHKAEKFEYLVLPLTRRICLDRKARELAALVAQYAGQDLTIVGHSNGCELICRMLKVSGVKIKRLHLISGACDADFWKNGLNEALKSGRVGEVVVYVAEKDWPMRLARFSQTLLGWAGLGYGSLGLDGPRNLAPEVVERDLVWTVRRSSFGHSDWFLPVNFGDLMQMISLSDEARNLRPAEQPKADGQGHQGGGR